MKSSPRILVLIWEGRRHEFDMESKIDVRFFEKVAKAIISGEQHK